MGKNRIRINVLLKGSKQIIKQSNYNPFNVSIVRFNKTFYNGKV